MKLLDTSTHTPLLLYLLERHEPDDEDFVKAIIDIEPFVVRRFVCGLTTQGYNRIFLERLLVEMGQEDKADSATLRSKLLALSGPSQRWPNNEEFEAAWLVRRLYQGANTRRVRAVLEGLEASLKSHKTDKEFLLDDLSVEHVMPQKWETHYPLEPDTPENRLRREDLIHSIGNLTLVTSSFNTALSNEKFSLKRPEIAGNSAMRLNAYFQNLTDDHDWNEASITARAKCLFETARSAWPHPLDAKA